LHQTNREIRDGCIVATIADDYEAVRRLIDPLIAEESDAHVPPAQRETVEAVADLLSEGRETVLIREIAERLKIDRQATYNRVHRAIASGYLENTNAGKRGTPLKIKLGADLPQVSQFLPPGALLETFKAAGPGI
jgi:DNA invertase Pin-like site-specific DNA recombinase